MNRWRHRDADFIAALNRSRQDLSQDFRHSLAALLPGVITTLRDGLASESIGIRLRVAETLIRALRTFGEADGPTKPDVIRLEWDTERAAVELEKRFSIL